MARWASTRHGFMSLEESRIQRLTIIPWIRSPRYNINFGSAKYGAKNAAKMATNSGCKHWQKLMVAGRGHANLLCIVPILLDVPEGTRVVAPCLLYKASKRFHSGRCGIELEQLYLLADRERGPLLSFEELVNDNTSNACKQQKICNNVASCDTVLPTEERDALESPRQGGKSFSEHYTDTHRLRSSATLGGSYNSAFFFACLRGVRPEPLLFEPLSDRGNRDVDSLVLIVMLSSDA
ncbi:hypothetical protein Tco_0908515 [Tanacetum coccineum]|uniref:Uncharacterized protein n=1 Tax=Tanacetum coccineum TaxID=301880 RepID=A0ABQ5CNG6_9ASTR